MFGQIDIYVFDQILRGNIATDQRILDAGCGYGRNLVYLLQAGTEVFAVDQDPEAIAHIRAFAAQANPALPPANFQLAPIERMPFPDAFADVVLSNSVLHFARDEAHFLAMLSEMWRCLRPDGLFFARLGSRIGMDFEPVDPVGRPHVYRIGDGSEWFLVSEGDLLQIARQMSAVQVDPLKTTVVQDYRCMTTWVLRKPIAPSGEKRGRDSLR